MVAALLAACGGGGGNSLTIQGQSFSAKDTISGSGSVGGSDTNTAGLVLMTSVSGACADLSASKQPKDSASLFFMLTDVNPTTFATSAPNAPGTYTISGSAAKSVAVSFQTWDVSCNRVSSASSDGATGTVNLTGVNNGAYAGDFDVIFESGDHVTGSFDGTACAAMSAMVEGTILFTCF